MLRTTNLSTLGLGGVLLLSAATTAQIQPTDVVIGEVTGKFNVDAITAADVTKTSNNARAITGHKNGNAASVALDPMAPFDLYAIGGGICIGFGTPLNHYILAGDKFSKNGAAAGCVDFAINLAGNVRRLHMYKGNRIFSTFGVSQGGVAPPGLFSQPGRSATRLATIDQAHDVATLGDKIYVSTRPASGSSLIVEVDMSGSTPKVLVFTLKGATGVPTPTIIECICADGHEADAKTLSIADSKGLIYTFDPSKGAKGANVTSQRTKSGAGQPVAMVWHPRATGRYVIATSTQVFDFVQWLRGVDMNGKPVGTPIYTSTSKIGDIAADSGGVEFYGSGCQASNGRTPRMDFGGSPYRGNNTFSGDCSNAPASAAALLVGGLSQTNIKLGNGCTALSSIFLAFPTKTDSTGKASVPFGLPKSASLIGLNVFAQYAIADGAGFVVTNGAKFVVR